MAHGALARAADLVGGLPPLDAAVGDRWRPVGEAVEVAHPCPYPIAAGVDDGRNIDTSHDAPSALLTRARGPSLALGCIGGGRGGWVRPTLFFSRRPPGGIPPLPRPLE